MTGQKQTDRQLQPRHGNALPPVVANNPLLAGPRQAAGQEALGRLHSVQCTLNSLQSLTTLAQTLCFIHPTLSHGAAAAQIRSSIVTKAHVLPPPLKHRCACKCQHTTMLRQLTTVKQQHTAYQHMAELAHQKGLN